MNFCCDQVGNGVTDGLFPAYEACQQLCRFDIAPAEGESAYEVTNEVFDRFRGCLRGSNYTSLETLQNSCGPLPERMGNSGDDDGDEEGSNSDESSAVRQGAKSVVSALVCGGLVLILFYC